MTTSHHTPIQTGESNSPATINTRLSTLDSAIENVDDRIDGLILESGLSDLEVADARNAGNTNNAVTLLSDRIEYAAAGAYHPMAYGATGDGTTNDRPVLASLFTTFLSGVPARVLIDRLYRVASALTVPANIQMEFVNGGRLVIDSGIKVTIQGSVNAGLYQIFAGDGTVQFDRGSQTVVHPEWFGASAIGTTDAAPAINKAIQSLQTGRATQLGGVVELAMGRYRIDSQILIDFPNVTLKGAGQQNTEIDATAITSGAALLLKAGAHHSQIIDLGLYQSNNPVSGSCTGIQIGDSTSSTTTHVRILGVKVRAFGGSGVLFWRAFACYLRDCWSVGNGSDGFQLTNSYNTSLVFDNCYADDNVSDGWDMASITYSTWIGCASENNGGNGYRIRGNSSALPTASLAFIACGTESNGSAGWYLNSDDANDVISGISLVACFAYNNNLSGAWSNLIYAHRTGTGAIIDAVTLLNCRSQHPAPVSNNDVIVNGSGASVLIDNCSLFGTVLSVSSGTIYNRDVRPTYNVTSVTTDRDFNANTASLDEIADVLGTLIQDLRARGFVL